MNRTVLFAVNRVTRKADREELPALISRAHFDGAPISIEAVKVIDATKDAPGFRVYRASSKEN